MRYLSHAGNENQNFEPTPSGNGRVRLLVRNQTLFPIRDIYLAVVLSDASGNAVGVSSSKIDVLAGEASEDVFFTWRHPFSPPPALVEAYLRTNLTE